MRKKPNKRQGVGQVKLSEVITVSPAFQRSVNVKHDMTDPAKISGYIPTEKAEACLFHFLLSVRGDVQDNAYMLIGSYGTGKSHLVTVMASLVGKKVSSAAFHPVLEKLLREEVRTLFAEEVNRKGALSSGNRLGVLRPAIR